MDFDIADVLDVCDGAEVDELQLIQAHISKRLQILGAQKGLSMNDVKRGDTVRFTKGVRPQYLHGLTATVVKRNRTRIVVSCPAENEYRRFSGATDISCPLSILEVAE